MYRDFRSSVWLKLGLVGAALVLGTTAWLTIDAGRAVHRWHQMKLSPDARLLAARNDRFGELWDVEARRLIRRFVWVPFEFAPDGLHLATHGPHGLELVDAATGAVVRRFGSTPPFTQAVTFSPDGNALAALDDDGMLRVWEVASGRLIWSAALLPGDDSALVFSPGGSHVAVARLDGRALQISVWVASDGTPAGHGRREHEYREGTGVRALAFHGDERAFRVEMGSVIARCRLDGGGGLTPLKRIRNGIYSADGRFVALREFNVLQGRSSIRVIDVNTDRERVLAGMQGQYWTALFTQQQELVAVSGTGQLGRLTADTGRQHLGSIVPTWPGVWTLLLGATAAWAALWFGLYRPPAGGPAAPWSGAACDWWLVPANLLIVGGFCFYIHAGASAAPVGRDILAAGAFNAVWPALGAFVLTFITATLARARAASVVTTVLLGMPALGVLLIGLTVASLLEW
jgi:hypothetical protein